MKGFFVSNPVQHNNNNKMTTIYKCRAECGADIERVMKVMRGVEGMKTIKIQHLTAPFGIGGAMVGIPDTEWTFECDINNVAWIRACWLVAANETTMLETLQYEKKYTGVRKTLKKSLK